MAELKFLDCEIKMPMMRLPVRSVVAVLGGAKVLLSPGSELADAQYAEVAGITDIVAPSLLHCAGVSKAAAKFPQAKVWGIPGAEKHRPQMPWSHELTPETWPYQKELTAIPLLGMPGVRETVFVHQASSTLIVTDLSFNLQHTHGLGSWIMAHLFGTYHRFAVSRLFARFVKNKAEFRASLDELFRHDFRRIVMSHGENIEENGKVLLRAALAERGF